MGRVSPVFDTAQRLLVVDSEDGRTMARSELTIEGLSAPLRVQRLTASGVNTLICGAISRPLINMILAARIVVIPFVVGEVAEVLEAHFDGSLTDPRFLMPGCQRRGRGRRFRHRGGGGRQRYA